MERSCIEAVYTSVLYGTSMSDKVHC